MTSTKPTVTYHFHLPDGEERTFTVDVSADSYSHGDGAGAPAWTALDHETCWNCPLDLEGNTHCPAALSIWELVVAFDDLKSFDTVGLTVVTGERSIVFEEVPIQRALGALMGLVLPTSGCPHTAFFRPMARFHLPLASVEETIYRASSMYLLGEWLGREEGRRTRFDLAGLTEMYNDVKVVNRGLCARLSGETTSDSSQNAVVLLDILAQFLPMAVESSLSQVRPLFEAYVGRGPDHGSG